MDFLVQLGQWLFDPANWQGSNGIPARGWEHIWYSGVSTFAALAIALPVGLWSGHTGRAGALVINIANFGRSIPSLGIIILLVVISGLGFFPGVFVALTAFAIPPILTNTYTGVREVDAEVREAASGMGMRGHEMLLHVELPVAMPLMMAGIRTSAVQVVATATIAAAAGLGGFGRYIINGFSVQDFTQVLAGAVLVAVLSIVVEIVLAGVQRVVVPAGLAREAATSATATKLRSRTA